MIVKKDRKLFSYVSISKSMAKLEKLLKDNGFISLKEENFSIDWQSVRSIELAKLSK